MRNKSIIALVIALGILLAGSIWWLSQTGDNARTLEELELQGMSAILQYDLTDPRKVHFLWQGITGETAALRVYRSKDNATWELWQEVTSPDATGSLTFLTEGANARDYQYRVEIVSVDGETVVILPPAPLVPPPTTSSSTTSGGTAYTTSTNTSIPSSTTSTPPVSSSPTTTTPVATTSTPPTTSTSSSPTSTGNTPPLFTTYYTPSGAVSGTSSVPLITDTVWVRHYGNNIEVGWQNLSADVETVTVSRSAFASGPWKQLLQHTKVTGVSVGSVQFSNAVRYEDQYYLFETTRTSGSTSSLGVVFLPGVPR